MALPPTSRLRFRDPSGTPLPEPTEWAPALVEVRISPTDWEEVGLWCNADKLPIYVQHLGEEVCVLAEWPRSGPGHYELRLEFGDHVEDHVLTITPQKISVNAYGRMLEDLETRLPAAVALALQRCGGLSGVKILPPDQSTLAQQLLRLTRAVLGTRDQPGLSQILVELAQDPHQMLISNSLWVRRQRARRPHPARLAHALARPHNLAADDRPEQVLDARVEHSADVYENRLLKTFYYQVNVRLRRVAHVLGLHHRAALSEQALALLRQLQQARRQAAFLDQVSLPAHLPTHLSMVLLKRPPYRAALQGYLDFHQSLAVTLEDSALDAPLENLPYLYQIWGTLEILLALQEIAVELGYRLEQQRLVQFQARGLYVQILPSGRSALNLVHPPSNTTVRFVPEPSYAKGVGLHSISYTQRPDVAVEITRVDDKLAVYLFDPKYKLEGEAIVEGIHDDGDSGRPKKVDIDKMHAYRDAIRDSSGRRVVQYAAILYPGPHEHFADGLEALPAYPGQQHHLQHHLRRLFQKALSEPL